MIASSRAPFVAVTGAAGFVASSLIASLLAKRQPVLAIDDFDDNYPATTKRRNLADLERLADRTGTPFLFRRVDITAANADLFADTDVTAVVHLAARVGVRASLEAAEPYLHTNVGGTVRLLELCRQAGILRFVFASSSSVYGDTTPAPFREDGPTAPLSPYAASKRAAELYLSSYARLYGMRIALARLFTVYGPRQRPDLALTQFAQAILAGTPVRLYGGESLRDYTFVDDVGHGLSAALQWTATVSEGRAEAFNIASGTTVKLSEVVGWLASALDRRAVVETAPRPAGDVESTWACVAKSRAMLGYSPQVAMPEGIARFVQWFTKPCR